MLKQASVQQIRSGEVSRRDGYLVVGMCHYPRALRRELRDEYNRALAPDKALFREFRAFEKDLGHEEAFIRSRFEERFQLEASAELRLGELVEMSRSRDVFLVCQCRPGESCHRELLLLLAREKFGAEIAAVSRPYGNFLRRIRHGL